MDCKLYPKFFYPLSYPLRSVVNLLALVHLGEAATEAATTAVETTAAASVRRKREVPAECAQIITMTNAILDNSKTIEDFVMNIEDNEVKVGQVYDLDVRTSQCLGKAQELNDLVTVIETVLTAQKKFLDTLDDEIRKEVPFCDPSAVTTASQVGLFALVAC